MENSHPDGGPGRPAAISEVNPLAWRPQQLQQLGDVGGDALGEPLPVGVADDEAGLGLLDGPGRREAARGGHEGKIIASAAGRTSG